MTEAKDDEPEADGKLKRTRYERELARLHVEFVKLQHWVVHKGLKICILFEGRDGAGKGGTIKAITERVSPRIFRVVAFPAPTEREKSQMYSQRYLPHLPAAGEIVIFGRSWYNRAGVEPGDGILHRGGDQALSGDDHPSREGHRRIRCGLVEILAGGQSRRADKAAGGANR